MDAGLSGKWKRAVDAAMTVALLFLMGYQFWGDAAHEWAGAGILVLFAVHHILNWRWHKNLFQGKYSTMRIFQVCIDVLTLFSMVALIYSSIVLSRYVFAFLPVEGGMALARRLHILGSYWGFLPFLIGTAISLYGIAVFIRRDFLRLYRDVRGRKCFINNAYIWRR